MKVLFLTDLHGKNPLPFIKEQIKKEKIGKIICLGDYDDPKILEDLIIKIIDKKEIINPIKSYLELLILKSHEKLL